MQQLYMDGFIKGYARKAMYIQDITHHPYKHIIEKRAKILLFRETYGTSAAIAAFGVSRSTLYAWKRQLKQGHGRLSSLAPHSTRPHHVRSGVDYQWHMQQILVLREQYPGIGKDKLKVLLDVRCRTGSQIPISVSTVGRIIARLQQSGRLPTRYQLTYSARTRKLTDRKCHRSRLKKARRGSFRPQVPGDLVQVDCVLKIVGSLRRYVISAIDYRSQFAFSYGYKTLSSTTATDFLVKLRQVAPFDIQRVQTDNGAEFHKHFHSATEQLSITHFWNYPRSPKMNAKIERYNRTVQDEFVDWHLDELQLNTHYFNTQLMDWLVWYNTERPHWSLKLQSPMQYLLQVLQLIPTESRMLWTDTNN